MTKVVAYFLPQYHEIPENNDWWGEGFTEWTNLKKAVPLFKGHQIPAPLNDNYYNLLEKETVVWQTELMKEYAVHGLVYYHYWFLGKKILERPAENLLQWKDIDQKFMFMWANHDWTRSWVGGKEILLKQEYGKEQDWLNHFDYLLDFFKDERYIKIDNKPVFQIYIGDKIDCFDEMVAVWDSECVKNGFDGIYIIETVDKYEELWEKKGHIGTNAFNILEHSMALNFWRKNYPIQVGFEKFKRLFTPGRRINSLSYSIVVKNSLRIARRLPDFKMIYLGVTTGWDNTPRYGSRGYIVSGSSPEKFRTWLSEAKVVAEKRKQDFIFISCWNEWCEGMCLEPTKQDGHGYLEVVRSLFSKS